MTTPQSLHELWDEESDAAEGIRACFGLQQALDYFVGEKLFTFLRLARRDVIVANELPAFTLHIRRLFTPVELRQYLSQLQRKRVILRAETDTNRRALSPRFTRAQLEELLLPA